jgi:O-antigen/teichoic acid export membrane protein
LRHIATNRKLRRFNSLEHEALPAESPSSLTARLTKSTFIRHNAVFFFGSLGVGALNYLYYPILGRLLTPSSFGEVQTLFSLFAQITIFLNVLALLTVNIITNYDDSTRAQRIILELEKLAMIMSFGLLAVTAFCSVLLQHFFKFDSAAPFTILVLAAIVSVLFIFRNAFLRGKQKFGLVAFTTIVGSAGDLIFSVVLVLLHTYTTGAIAGLVLGQAAALCLAASYAHRHGFVEHVRGTLLRLPDIQLILPELRYASLVLTGSLVITLMYSIDIIVAKHFFDARTAGLYAGISTVARIIFFVTASIAQVLMPAIKLQHSARQNRLTLAKSFALLLGIGGTVWIVFALAPRFIIRVLMGGSYLAYSDLLPRLGLALLFISMLNLFVIYHIALRRYGTAFVAIGGFAVTLGLVYLHHNDLQAVVTNLLYGSLSMLVLFGGWLGIAKRNNSHA